MVLHNLTNNLFLCKNRINAKPQQQSDCIMFIFYCWVFSNGFLWWWYHINKIFQNEFQLWISFLFAQARKLKFYDFLKGIRCTIWSWFKDKKRGIINHLSSFSWFFFVLLYLDFHAFISVSQEEFLKEILWLEWKSEFIYILWAFSKYRNIEILSISNFSKNICIIYIESLWSWASL